MDIKAHFFPIKSQGDKRRAQRHALAREAPGPPKGHWQKSALPELTWKPVSGARSKSGAIKAVP
jgi:hypothetical protein